MTTPFTGLVPAQASDRRTAQVYIAEAKTRCQRDRWQWRPINISKENEERFLTLFRTLDQLAGTVDAALHHMFVSLTKDLFDELVNIITLIQLQSERLHSQTQNTSPYIMSLNDVVLSTSVLHAAESVVSAAVGWVGSEEHPYRRGVANRAHAEMCVSLDRWFISKGTSNPSRSAHFPGPFPSRIRSHSIDASQTGPARIHRRSKFSRGSPPGLRLTQLRSASLPSLSSTYAQASASTLSAATPPSLSAFSTRGSLSDSSRSPPPRKRSLDMRTPDTPVFQFHQPSKRTRQDVVPERKFSLVTSESTLVADGPNVSSAADPKGKGKAVEQWLQSIEEVCGSDDAGLDDDEWPLLLNPFDMDVDDDRFSDATASSSGHVLQPELGSMGEATMPYIGTTPAPEDEDGDTDSFLSDSSWGSCVRGDYGPPTGAYQIRVDPAWFVRQAPVPTETTETVELAYRSLPSYGTIEMEGSVESRGEKLLKLPLWLRVLRKLFSCCQTVYMFYACR